MVAFKSEVKTRKAVHPTLITLEGARHNTHFNSVVLQEVQVADWIWPGGTRGRI